MTKLQEAIWRTERLDKPEPNDIEEILKAAKAFQVLANRLPEIFGPAEAHFAVTVAIDQYNKDRKESE